MFSLNEAARRFHDGAISAGPARVGILRRHVLCAWIVALGFASAAIPAHAGRQSGKVAQILTRAGDGLTAFYLSGASTEKPACAKYNYWMIRDENSAVGRRQLAILMLAHATGQVVTVYGMNSCLRWVDGEDVDLVELGVAPN